MKQFTLYWKTGTRQVVEGENILQAMVHAGYSSGAVRALDFYAEGDNGEYQWDGKMWSKPNFLNRKTRR